MKDSRDKNRAVAIVKKAQEDLDAGKITRRDFNSIMMTLGALAGYTLFNSFAGAWTGTRMRKSSGANNGHQILRSLRFRRSASAYLSKTFGAAGNQQKWTWSGWVKSSSSGTSQILFSSYVSATDYAVLSFSMNSFISGTDTIKFYTTVGNATQCAFSSNALFRDSSAWYHVHLAIDTAQATSTDRVKISINGSQITSFATATYPAQSANIVYINSTTAQQLGALASGTYGYLDGYMSDVYFVDGQALDVSSFGAVNNTTGVWSAKKYAGTFGTNGYYLDFSDTTSTATISADKSGNGNNWTTNNISLTAGTTYDSMTDVPLTYGTSDRGNFCIMSPIAWTSDGALIGTLSNANLKVASTSSISIHTNTGTMAITTPTYFEVHLDAFDITYTSGGGICGFGISSQTISNGGVYIYLIYTGANANGNYWVADQSSNAVVTQANFGTPSVGNIYGFAYDPTTRRIWISKNGVWYNSGNPAAGTGYVATIIGTAPVFPYWLGRPDTAAANTQSVTFNFGQRAFAYTAPTGFKTLSTNNFTAPVIKKPKLYFDVVTRAGTGAAASVASLGFAPDLVWIKARNNVRDHGIFDTSRGVNLGVRSNTTGVENTFTQSLTAFNSTGYSLGTSASESLSVNLAADNFVDWSWKKGVTPGFDIVTFTGTGTSQVVNHSLGVTPKVIFIKRRDAVDNWFVNHASFPTPVNNYLFLNTTGTLASGSSFTATSSTTFSLGSQIVVSAATYVTYLWAEVAGFSRFGSYIGNASTDGPFIYCGFKPRFVMIKSTTAVEEWLMLDSQRGLVNINTNRIYASSTNAEDTSGLYDFLSNGFKIRNGGGATSNQSGQTYIYMAFAEVPFQYALGR